MLRFNKWQVQCKATSQQSKIGNGNVGRKPRKFVAQGDEPAGNTYLMPVWYLGFVQMICRRSQSWLALKGSVKRGGYFRLVGP